MFVHRQGCFVIGNLLRVYIKKGMDSKRKMVDLNRNMVDFRRKQIDFHRTMADCHWKIVMRHTTIM